jgi:hypothetical protein
MYVVPEDFFVFHWWPPAESKGSHAGFEDLPLARVLFRKHHALSVHKLVVQIVDAIQDALSPPYREWVKGWRYAMIVPALLKEGRWEPNLKPSKAYTSRKRRR